MEWFLLYAALGIGAAGFLLMLGAFALVASYGGWQQAMQPDARGRWPLPRLLMLAGAALGTLFGLLLFLPGTVPWWDVSAPGTAWAMGAIFGFSVCLLYHWITRAVRQVGDAQARGSGHRTESPAERGAAPDRGGR